MTMLYGFAQISDRNARLLILGSMPGRASLEAGQFYANPRNVFWRIMESILDIPAAAPYEQRAALLIANGVALWDVVKACMRSGSLDSDIVDSSIVPNDFQSFFESHRGIEAVYFNGAKAERSYTKYVSPKLSGRAVGIALHRLPSTSPAHASLSFDDKVERWRLIAPPAREAR